MEKSLFRYIWRHSRRDQLIIFAIVIASLPFYFMSLDLPRRIVNEVIQGRAFEQGRETAPFLELKIGVPEWLGGASVQLFEGFQVGRYELLFGLSAIFLVLVLINGAFKYVINVSKGALGERMLRRMRYDLFGLILRFHPQALRNIKAAEAATIVKDEVEPIGGFIGDAFVLPLFLGTQALTALAFIMIQNVWLGLMAAGVVGIQFTIIPRLRRELLRLGRERQLASRRLAGRIGEVLDGMELISVHNSGSWERAEIGQRLFQLFDLRFRIFKRKFMVKFLNNLLAQLTPFFFFAIGGYFALNGTLSIGQLVAVIAAYRELPPPLKELIDWDQMRLDVQVKYDQITQFFASDRLGPADDRSAAAEDEPLTGDLTVEDLRVLDPNGTPIIDGASLTVPLPARVAVVGNGGPAASVFARILGRRAVDHQGRVLLGNRGVGEIPAAVAARRLVYAGSDPVLFPGSLRDNLVYGLRRRPMGQSVADGREERRRLMEAARTGNPPESIEDEWIDYESLGMSGPDELDERLITILTKIGLEQDLYRFGLSGRVNLARYPHLEDLIIAGRQLLREKLDAENLSHLVEAFDADRYNAQATIAENLLFGVPVSRRLTGRALAEHHGFRRTLAGTGLTRALVDMGAAIAETMTEIFRGLPAGHPLFEQFSFLSADELPEYEDIVRRRGLKGRAGFNDEDRTKLLALALFYVEPRHRLGLLKDEHRALVVETRAKIRATLEEKEEPGVEFYDPERVCFAAPVKDNLLFGRVTYSVADASERVMRLVAEIVEELDMRADLERVGLDHQVGPAGRLLSPPQRAAVNLARCVVKRPDILILDGALAPFGEVKSKQLMGQLLEAFAGRTLIATLPNDRDTDGFDTVISFENGRAILRAGDPALQEQTGSDQDEAGRRVPAARTAAAGE
jgi:putative ABC transport system ATP-binding protein